MTSTTAAEPSPSFVAQKCLQRVTESGKIHVSKLGWVVRVVIIAVVGALVYLTMENGFRIGDPLIVYSTIMPLHSFAILIAGWFVYRNPAKGKLENDLVSVIIPVFNQKGMIEIVVDSIFRSSYKNIEVIAVNDGSKDGTREILNELAKRYPQLKVIHTKNQGKRKAVASGVDFSKGKFIVLIDSDSVLEENAIAELLKAFNSDPKIGGAVGHVKVWNADKNFLTKFQDAWYDFSFNIQKTCESSFGSVTCCSGCLAAYRREIIHQFVHYWAAARIQDSDDRELTSYVLASKWAKKEYQKSIAPQSVAQKLMESAANYDDSEDRVLTAQALGKWKTVYVATAIVYTDVPEKFRGFLRQQERWKKGYLRTNFYISSFFWHGRNPLMTLIYYTELMAAFTTPLIVFAVLVYSPLVLQQYQYPLYYLAALLIKGIAIGLDYKFRDPSSKNWKYNLVMYLFTNFIVSWILFPALLHFRKNNWMTR